jgi:hypothetical protein
VLIIFECVVTHVTDKLDSSFLCKGPSSISVKIIFNILVQSQLLKVESPRDIDIVKVELCYILCSCFIITFFSHISLIVIFL